MNNIYGITENIVHTHNKLSIGSFNTYYKIYGGCFYLYSDINTDRKLYDQAYLFQSFDFWEKKAIEIGCNTIVINPSVFNYFERGEILFKTRGYRYVLSKDATTLTIHGVPKNSYNWIKYMILNGKHDDAIIDIGKKVHAYIKKIKIKEPRTSFLTSAKGNIYSYTFYYRGSSITLPFLEEEGSFYLKEDKKSTRYPLNNQGEIEENINEILNLSYKRVRTKFLMNPPKTHFYQTFSFLPSKERQDMLYDYLRKEMDYNQIEDVCYMNKHIPFYIPMPEAYFMILDKTIYLFLDGFLSSFPIEERAKTLELFETFTLNNMRKKLQQDVSELFKEMKQ